MQLLTYNVKDFKFTDIVANSGIDVKDLRERLEKLFLKQLSYCGVVYSGNWPEFKIVGKSDTANFFDYTIDQNGNIQES